MDDKFKLKYRLIDSSTEDPNYPLNSLMKGLKGNGWSSVRFCIFPQEIIVQFYQPVHIKQINVIVNEKKIPSMIAFSSFLPKTHNDCHLNYKQAEFDSIGYIKMSTNLRSNFKARELRKVFLDKMVLFFKIQLYKNYNNKYNIFNQVGLVSIEFYGKNLPISPDNKLYSYPSIKPMKANDDDLDPLSTEKLRVLKSKMNEAIKKEEYEECSLIKKSIDKVRTIGLRIFDLEIRKKEHINNEDFESAKITKNQIDKLKNSLKNMDKQPSNISIGNEEDKNYVPNENEIKQMVNEPVQSLNDIDNFQNNQKKNKFSNVNLSGNFERSVLNSFIVHYFILL